MKDDFRPLRKPRMTFDLRVDYDPNHDCRWLYRFDAYNGFGVCFIVLNLRIRFQYVKDNYS